MREFYVLSLKYSHATYWLWWRPNARGYTEDLNEAGRYTEEEIRRAPRYYNDNDSTRAIPVEAVESLKMCRVVYMNLDDERAMKAASTAALGEPTTRAS